MAIISIQSATFLLAFAWQAPAGRLGHGSGPVDTYLRTGRMSPVDKGVILMVARTRRFTHAVGSPFLECGVTCSTSLNLQAFSTPQHTRVLYECNRRRPGIAWNTFHMPMPLSGQLGRPRSIQIVQLAYRLCSCNNMATWHWGTSVLHSPTITTIRGILWVYVCIRRVILRRFAGVCMEIQRHLTEVPSPRFYLPSSNPHMRDRASI